MENNLITPGGAGKNCCLIEFPGAVMIATKAANEPAQPESKPNNGLSNFIGCSISK